MFRVLLSRGVVRRAARYAAVPAVVGKESGSDVWKKIDGSDRERFTALARSAPAGGAALTDIRRNLKSQANDIATAKDKKAHFWKQDFKTLTDLVTFYENLMYPLHVMKDDHYTLWVERCDLWSKISQTKNASQSDLDGWKARHEELGNMMAAIDKEREVYVSGTFDTAIYNHVLSALRLAAETNEAAHAQALQVFHDMNDNSVAFDATTRVLLRNVCFGDSYFDNSDLLMSNIEYPERGEHTLGKNEDLTKVSVEMLDVIGKRHKIDVKGVGVTFQHPERLLSPQRDMDLAKESGALIGA